MTQLSGKILDQLAHFSLQTKYSKLFLNFILQTAEDPFEDLRAALCYNLPFFFYNYKTNADQADCCLDVY